MAPKIHWTTFNKTIEVKSGQSVLEAALDFDIPLEHACGGVCACTTCHIHVTDGQANLSTMDEEETDRLEYRGDRDPKSRLACQAKVLGDITIEIP